jgi:hypothetical protein
MHIHPAVDADRLTGHEVAVDRGEKNDGAYQILRVFDRKISDCHASYLPFL